MESFANLHDITNLYRELTNEESAKAESLLPVVSDRLRQAAKNVGKDLDHMIERDPVLANVAKSVTVDIVARTLQTPTEGAPLSQFSQSALGYTQSGTYLSPGGGIFIKNSELKALGLLKQRYGVIDIYGVDHDHRHHH